MIIAYRNEFCFIEQFRNIDLDVDEVSQILDVDPYDITSDFIDLYIFPLLIECADLLDVGSFDVDDNENHLDSCLFSLSPEAKAFLFTTFCLQVFDQDTVLYSYHVITGLLESPPSIVLAETREIEQNVVQNSSTPRIKIRKTSVDPNVVNLTCHEALSYDKYRGCREEFFLSSMIALTKSQPKAIWWWFDILTEKSILKPQFLHDSSTHQPVNETLNRDIENRFKALTKTAISVPLSALLRWFNTTEM